MWHYHLKICRLGLSDLEENSKDEGGTLFFFFLKNFSITGAKIDSKDHSLGTSVICVSECFSRVELFICVVVKKSEVRLCQFILQYLSMCKDNIMK